MLVLHREQKRATIFNKTREESRGMMLTEEEIAELVDQAIRSFQDSLESAGGKVSVGDLVRLVQLRKELTDERPGNVTVQWVDECETPSER